MVTIAAAHRFLRRTVASLWGAALLALGGCSALPATSVRFDETPRIAVMSAFEPELVLLRGEREVTVEVGVVSDKGTARMDVHRVKVGNAVLAGRALEMVIDYYVMPRFPDAAIGRPFALRHNIKRISVTPAGINFAFGPPPPSPPPPAPPAPPNP